MAFCIKCGTQIPQGSAVCTACGALAVQPQFPQPSVPPVPAAPPVPTVPPAETPYGAPAEIPNGMPNGFSAPAPAPMPAPNGMVQGMPVTAAALANANKQKKTKFLIGGAIAAVVLLVLFLIFNPFAGGHSTMQGAVETYGEAVFTGDYSKALHQLPDKLVSYLCKNAHLTEEQYLASLYGRRSNVYEDVKITELISYDAFSTSSLSSLNTKLENAGINSLATEAYSVRFRVQFIYNGTPKTATSSCKVFKLDGKWYAGIAI